MAGWITHLRVAGKVAARWPLPDPDAFFLGNVAPDSGEPSPDGMSYMPPKEVSHFRVPDSDGRILVGPQAFADQYLASAPPSPRDASFLLGYLTHLVTDRLWALEILAPEKASFADLLARDKAGFYRLVKADWYDLDFLYLREHPDFSPWQRYAAMPDVTNRWVSFFSADAFVRKRASSLAFYRDGSRSVRPRSMPVLTAARLDAFVDATAAHLLTDWRGLFLHTLKCTE